jgi:hypothetical protein
MKKMFVLGSLIALVLVVGLGSCSVENQNVEQSVDTTDSVEFDSTFVDSVEVETEVDTTL